ncbi:MAG: EAL domain-containing protein, partial [Herbaspirillum sp.]
MNLRKNLLSAAESPTPDPEEATEQRPAPEQERKQLANQRDDVVQSREHVADQREDVLQRREQVVDQRDDSVQGREHYANERDYEARGRVWVMRLRERRDQIREAKLNELSHKLGTLESHVDALRKANENLLIANLKTQAMAEEAQAAKEQLANMARHDFLTGLPNRILLEERMTRAIALAKRHGKKLAVLFIDLDRFKTVNDSLGHAVGDALLQAVAQRLLSSVRSSDTVSRQGGDEFVALLTEVTDETAVAEFADKIRKAISAPYQVTDHSVHVGVTIGISLYPNDGGDADTLIRHADVAMYHTKKEGGNDYSFFRHEMNVVTVERQKIEADLFGALQQDQFELHYQPQVDITSGRILGAEALIRWHHPTRGLLQPADFVPIAYGCGAIIPIGRWVLRQACRQAQIWRDAGLALPIIAVNVSAYQFKTNDFLEELQSILTETRLEPQHLELELTESVLMTNAESTMLILQELKKMGIKIGIDDFGTGYSSLSYLQQFPVDTLKIDRSFVTKITTSSGAEILVES